MSGRPLRVLLATSMFDDSFGENVQSALTRLGIEVVAPRRTNLSWYGSSVRGAYLAVRRKLDREYLSALDRWVLRAARRHKPEIVLALTFALSEPALAELKAAGITCVAWWCDAPGNMQQMGLFSRYWDAIFLKDPDGVAKFRRVGLNAHLLHEAMNPEWHRPLATRRNDDVVIAGNFYAFRQFLTLCLLERGHSLRLYGGPLPRWAHPTIRRMHTGRYLVKEEKSRVFGEAMACINSTHVVEGNSLNARNFEIAGAAGVQISEYRPIVDTCFEPGKGRGKIQPACGAT